MSIDITHLTADELVELNHQIIERLKMLETLETHKSMMQLHSGARVSFESPAGERIVGTVMKLNVRDPSSPHSKLPPDARCCAPDFFLEPARNDAPRQQSRKSLPLP